VVPHLAHGGGDGWNSSGMTRWLPDFQAGARNRSLSHRRLAQGPLPMMQKATLNSEPSLSKLGHSDFQIRTKRSELGHYPRVKLKSQLSIRNILCRNNLLGCVRAGSTGAYKSEALSLHRVFPELAIRNHIGLETLSGRVLDGVPISPSNPLTHPAIDPGSKQGIERWTSEPRPHTRGSFLEVIG
jgi:hypothetical protein